MKKALLAHLEQQLLRTKYEGLYKEEKSIVSPQGTQVLVQERKKLLNLCANNYLGLANHPALVEAAKRGLQRYGFGMASVRFICGTLGIHKELEAKISHFLQTEETILYSSCFDANGGLFETLLEAEDAIISDELNHASIIDGVRLCKAQRFRYKNNDMGDLEGKLQQASSCRHRIIATDGVFSMDGTIANLAAICDLADRYDALVMVDDCHATGFMGEKGLGTHEYCGVMGRVDILTGTLGKALGGASGGYTSGRKEIIEWLRQRSRPYLFSNALCPAITEASLEVLQLIESSGELREKLHANSRYFRKAMEALGFNLVPGSHPIIPIMIGEATTAKEFAAKMLQRGVYVVSFSYPVVPKGKARIRTQMNAALTTEELDMAIAAFGEVGKEMGIIK